MKNTRFISSIDVQYIRYIILKWSDRYRKSFSKGLPTSEEDFNNKIADWKENGNDEQKALAEKLSKLNDNQNRLYVSYQTVMLIT